MMAAQEFRYFSSVEGRKCPRFGKGLDALIGAKIKITRDSKGRVTRRKVVWDTARVVKIPAPEVIANLKSYQNALRRGDLKERNAQDHGASPAPAPATPSAPEASEPGTNEGGEPEGAQKGAQDEAPEVQSDPSALDEAPSSGAGKSKRRRRRSRGE